MELDTFTSLDQVPAEVWDGAVPKEFYFQRAFLRVMEESAVEGARYRYLILKEGGRAVGLAVLTHFPLKLDLLSGDPWIRRLRRVVPALLDLPIICCGIPASFGQNHLHAVQHDRLGLAFQVVHKAMEDWAEETGAGVLLWKEWNPGIGLRSVAFRDGYVVLPTLPDHRVEEIPPSIEAWMSSLRSDYRRKYQTAADLMAVQGSVRKNGALLLEEAPFTEQDSADFFRGYRYVMARTPVRLETYTENFFQRLAGSDVDVRLLRLSHPENAESLTAMLVPSGDVLSFVLVSKDRPRYRMGLYTKLLQCIVLRGIQGRFREVRLGQTSDYAKSSVGARPFRLETFIQLRSPWKHRLLERFGTRLFPEVAPPRLSVFRS